MKNSFYEYFDCSSKEELYQKLKNNEVQELSSYFEFLKTKELQVSISRSDELLEFINAYPPKENEIQVIMLNNSGKIRTCKNFDINDYTIKDILKDTYDTSATKFILTANLPDLTSTELTKISYTQPFKNLEYITEKLEDIGYSKLIGQIITGDNKIIYDDFSYFADFSPSPSNKNYFSKEIKNFSYDEEYREFVNHVAKKELKGLNLVEDREEIKNTLIKSYGGLSQEQLGVILYNQNNDIIDIINPFVGQIDRSQVDLRIVTSTLLREDIKGIQLIHNHPSGNIRPSKQDINLTEAIENLSILLEKQLTDHYIIGNDIFSFSEEGMLLKSLKKTNSKDLEISEESIKFKRETYKQIDTRDKFKENRKQFVEEVIKSLENNKIPWEKSWENPSYNPTTGARYRGGNSIKLSLEAFKHNYKDPRWITFVQAKEQGWKIKKGAKAVTLEVFKYYDTSTKKDLDIDFVKTLSEAEKKQYLKTNVKTFCKTFNVFNAEQIEGIPPLEEKKKSVNYNKIKLIEQNCGVPITFGGDMAFYSVTDDKICMPPKERFKNANSYYATMLHEIAHSTGHPSRLNRPLNNKFGTKDYAYEELIAEFSSVFIGQEKGLKYNFENNKAYIRSWVQLLKNDPNVLFRAAAQAEKATDRVLSYEKVINKELGKEKVKEKSKEKKNQLSMSL